MSTRAYCAFTFLVCLELGVAATPWVFAQQNARNLTGTVTDGHHEPLSGAVVQVHSEALGTVVSFITGRSGQYSFKRLDSDMDYDVSATWRGRHSRVRRISQFDSHTDKVLDLVSANDPQP